MLVCKNIFNDLKFVNNSSFTLTGWGTEGMEKEEH